MPDYSAGSASVDIKPNFRGFVRELRAELERVNAELDVSVGADTSAAVRDITALRELAERQLELNVGADTSSAIRDITALREAAGQDLIIEVDADTSRARARIASLRASSGGGGGYGMSRGLVTVGANVGALGLANLPAAATALASIGADMQALTQTLALWPGIMTGAAAGISTLVVGFQNMGDALGDSPEKAAEAMEKLSSGARDTVTTLRGFSDQWSAVRTNVQESLFAGMSEPLQQMISTQLPVLERSMTGVGARFNGLFKATLGELGSERSSGVLTQIFGNTGEAVGVLTTAIKPLLSVFGTLASTGSNFLPELAQGFTNLITRFDAFITKADQSGELMQWMREGIDATKTFGSVIANLGSSLSSIFRAVRGDGDGFLVTVDNLTDRMAAFLKSDAGQAQMREFFVQGREQMEQWRPVLQSLGTIIKSVYEAAQTWSSILMPFLTAAADLLADNETIVKSLLLAWLAYRTVGPILTGLQTAVVGTTGAMGRFRESMTDAMNNGAGRLRGSIAGLAGALGTGGLLGVAIAGAAIGLGFLAQKHQEAKQAADEQKRAIEALGETLDAQTGKVTQATITQASGMLEDRGFLERAQTLGVDTHQFVEASLGLDPAAKDAINQRLTGIILEQADRNDWYWAEANKSGISDETIAQALQGVPEAIDTYNEKMREGGPGLDELKNRLNDIAESAATLGGEMNNVNSETARLGESARRQYEAAHGAWQLTEEGAASFERLGIAVRSVPDSKTVVVDALTEEQQAELETLGRTVERLPDGTIKITLNDADAKAAIAEITKPETKVVTVQEIQNRVQAGIDNPTVRQNAPTYSPESGYVHYARGGPITGGIPGRDSVPMLGMPGEHVLTTSDVDRLGGQAGVYRFRAALQAGLVRGYRDGGAVGWTEKDEIDLQQAQTAVTQAEERAQRVLANPKSTEADKRQAQLKIDEARHKAQGLENKKNGIGTIAPQAPLPGRRSESELSRLDAEAAVDQANSERNRIYADPNSTPEQRAAADRDYQKAQNTLESQAASEKDGGLPEEYSLQGIFSRAGGILAEGILGFFGLENSILSSNNVYNRAFNSVVDFYSNKDEQATEGDGYSYQPKNLPVERADDAVTGSASSDDSEQHSYDPSGGVEQWRGTFASVLQALGLPLGWVDLGLRQMQTESGGNPRAINNWDINAKNGTPSKGLMQVIDPTFQSYKSGLYPDDIWHPSSNIAAALRYTVDRYGSPHGVWGQGHGYADGGWVFGPGGPRSDAINARLSNGEFVVNSAAAAANSQWLEAINSGMNISLPNLPAELSPRGGDVSNTTRDHSVQFNGTVNVMNNDGLVREMDRWAANQSLGALAVYS